MLRLLPSATDLLRRRQPGRYNRSTAAAENTLGYWRIGFDSLGTWPNAPASNFFAGSLAHAAVFDRVLPADEVAAQHAAGG